MENKVLIGNGNFSLAHRTHSSVFYYSSLFFLPFFELKLIHLSYFSTLVFSNLLIFEKILKKENINNINFDYYLYLISLIFINIIFTEFEYELIYRADICFFIFIYFF